MSYTKTNWVNGTTPINATNLNKIENGVEANDIAISTNTSNINELKGEILWTNSSPSSEFAGQTINLNKNLNNYNSYEILFAQSTTNSRLITTGRIPVGHGTIVSLSLSYIQYRPTGVTVSGSAITFEDARTVNTLGSATIANTSLIPMYVLGYKENLF